MVKANYHTHTRRCNHAYGTDEEYVLAAIEAGYTKLGFSDHTPWKYDSDFKATMRMDIEGFEDYKNSVLSLKDKYKDQIEIYLGLETEYFPKYMDWYKEFIKENNIDYVIFGNHYYKTDELQIYYGYVCKDNKYLELYKDDCINGMKTGIYSYLCHPDLFMLARSWDEDSIRISEEITDAAIKYDFILEYNLQGSKKALECDMVDKLYPHPEFFKMAGRKGCKVIIGVDAHEPLSLLSNKLYMDSVKRLKDYGCVLLEDIEFKNII